MFIDIDGQFLAQSDPDQGARQVAPRRPPVAAFYAALTERLLAGEVELLYPQTPYGGVTRYAVEELGQAPFGPVGDRSRRSSRTPSPLGLAPLFPCLLGHRPYLRVTVPLVTA